MAPPGSPARCFLARAATQQAGQDWDRCLPSLGVPPVLHRWEGAASAEVSRKEDLLCSGLVASPVGLCGTFR